MSANEKKYTQEDLHDSKMREQFWWKRQIQRQLSEEAAFIHEGMSSRGEIVLTRLLRAREVTP